MRVHAEAPRVVGDAVVLVAVDPGDVWKTVMVLSKLRISNKEKKKKIKTNQLTHVGRGGLQAR